MQAFQALQTAQQAQRFSQQLCALLATQKYEAQLQEVVFN